MKPINMDLKDYSILGASLQIALPWITILKGLYYSEGTFLKNFVKNNMYV